MSKLFTTLRNNWKKTILFTACGAYASTYVIKWHKEDLLMKEYSLQAREFGRHTITPNERPRKIIVFLNPAAKDGKTKYLLEKHVLPLLHLAGIEVHVVRTEHEGQAKAYMSVLDNNVVDAVVVAGGDGTLSEIVTGLLRRTDGIAQRMPIGVLPFGNTNSFASRIFPLRELEVERYCQASMAIIKNKFAMADVMEVSPLASDPTNTSDQERVESDPTPTGDTSAKKVYLLSHIKWGVHSEVERVKGKYWYMPGALKKYYCYLKTVLFNEWPPHVKADVEISPPCDGCCRCLTPTTSQPTNVKPSKSAWWWPTDNRKQAAPVSKPDPRLQVDNPRCGRNRSEAIDTHQLELISVKQNNGNGQSCSLIEMRSSPDVTKSELFLQQKSVIESPTVERQCTALSSITIRPAKTEYPWYIMDSEKYEVMPASITLLKDKIKVFTLSS